MSFNIYTHLKEHGRNTEAIKSLQRDLHSAKADVKRLEASRNITRGIWLAVVCVGSIAGALGSIITRVFFH